MMRYRHSVRCTWNVSMCAHTRPGLINYSADIDLLLTTISWLIEIIFGHISVLYLKVFKIENKCIVLERTWSVRNYINMCMAIIFAWNDKVAIELMVSPMFISGRTNQVCSKTTRLFSNYEYCIFLIIMLPLFCEHLISFFCQSL